MKNPKSIMLIEDDGDDQLFFQEALSEIENATLFGVASNGQEAMRRLQASPFLPDLIFSDIEMPVMNGIDCLIEIKKSPRLKNIPVIMLSSAETHAEVVCTLGALAFLKKPDSFDQLREQLNSIIDQHVVEAKVISSLTLCCIGHAA